MGQPRTHGTDSQEVAASFAIRPTAPSSVSVLIADDNATNRKLLRAVLESHGHAVLEADNGVTALKFLDERQVDAVISDILMPGMDGFRLCFEIRRNPKLRRLPFIVYTASYTSASDEKLALQFGADRFIRKPASANTIVETLYDVVESVRNQERIEVKIPEEAGVMRAYSQVLVSKLEQTIISLSETNKALAERTTLAEFAAAVGQAVSQGADLERMLRECCAATMAHLDAGSVYIWIMNERESVLELRACSPTHGDNRGVPARIPLGQSIIGLIAAEQKPHVTHDIIGDARLRDHEWAKREGMTAFAGYPLIIADQLVGVMATFAKTPFSQNTQAALGAAAGIIAVGIQRQLAEEKMRLNEARFRDLAENINEIFFVTEPDGGSVSYMSPAYEAITGRKRETLYQNPDAWLATIHADDRPRVERAFRDNSDGFDEEHRIIRPDGEIRWLRSRAGAVKNEQGKAARIVGIATDITEQKRAEAKVTEHLERIRALHEIDVAINSTLDLDTVLQVLLEKIDLFIPYPSVTTVRLRNRVSGHFEVLACRNIDAAEWKSEFIRSQGRAKRVMETKMPVTVRNLLTDPSTYNPDFYRRHGLISYASLPLVVRDEAIGVFNLYTKEEHEFSAEEVEFLLTLAGQAAIAINNARLHEHTQRHLRRIQGVSEINTAIASSLSLKNVLDVLLEKTELFCPVAVACGTRLFDEATGNMVPLASRHIPFEEWKQEVASAKGRLTRLLIETKRPVAILNMHTDSRTSMNQFARRHGLVSYLGVPLIAKDKFIGNLVIYTKKEYAFTAEEIEFFSNLGSQAAIAIHNAQLYEEARARDGAARW